MHIHDVLIVGAGPCGLAVAARLREHTPSATYTEDEHQRYHWIRKHGCRMNIKKYKTNTDSRPAVQFRNQDTKDADLDMLVLDADGAEWMTKWNRLFKTFGIEYLRSPMFFHIDPAHHDALLGFTYEKQREKELQALPGCAGKELSKHRKKKELKGRGRMSHSGPDIGERDRRDYFTPSTGLFAAHFEEVAKRYRLGSEVIRHERVADIEYERISAFQDVEHHSVISDDSSTDETTIFQVTTDRGVRFARIVVLAIGPGNAPSLPPVPGLFLAPCEAYSHAMQVKEFPQRRIRNKIEQKVATSLFIVGGGLTSVQLADLAIKRGVSKVWLLMRGPLKVKYFDVDLDWVGKFRNFNQAAFWSADTDEDRFQMATEARNGGSITPRYHKILASHVASGKISLHTRTTLQSLSWDAHSHTWTSVTSSPTIEFPPIDYIVFATGVQSNMSTLPFLKNIQQRRPIDYVGGLPCLNDDLKWDDHVPLFVTGRLAGLRLGPGAPNLVGARVGAERIAWNVEDILDKLGRMSRDGVLEGDEREMEYAAARQNHFASLAKA